MKKYLSINYNQLVVVAWFGFFVVLWIQLIPQTSVIEALLLPLFILVSAYPLTTYLSKHLLQKAMRMKKYTIFAVQYLFFSILIGFLFFAYSLLFVYFENKGYFPHSELFSSEDYIYYNILVYITFGIFVNLCFCGLRFYEENMKLQKSLLETQLQTLQNQITPHFMFNVLNHINILMQTDVDLASSLLIKYSEILRYQLYSGKNESIALEQEIQFLKDFVGIEKIRWEEKLKVECTWKVENGKIEVPPLLFIAFIENAFKHVSRTLSEKGFIDIDFMQQGNTICLEVKNSKSIPLHKKENSGLGLENTKKRLDMLYPKKYVLAIDDAETIYYSKLTITI